MACLQRLLSLNEVRCKMRYNPKQCPIQYVCSVSSIGPNQHKVFNDDKYSYLLICSGFICC